MRPLRIGVNALYLIPGGVGGTEIYLRNLLLALPPLPRDHETQQARVDYLGAGLLIAGILAVLFAINQLPSNGPSVLLGAVFAAGLVVLVLFVRRQLRITHPLIRMSFFRNPTFNLTNAILSGNLFIVIYIVSYPNKLKDLNCQLYMNETFLWMNILRPDLH